MLTFELLLSLLWTQIKDNNFRSNADQPLNVCAMGINNGNQLTIQVNDPGQQEDVVSQPSGTVVVNCYKDVLNISSTTPTSGAVNSRYGESESVCIKVIPVVDKQQQEEGDDDRANKNENCLKKANRATQCEEEEEVAKVGNNRSSQLLNYNNNSNAPNGNRNDEIVSVHRAGGEDEDGDQVEESQRSVGINKREMKSSGIVVDGNKNIHSGSVSSRRLPNNNNNSNCSPANNHHIDSDIKDTISSPTVDEPTAATSSQQQRSKSFKSTEAQTDNNFVQQQQQQQNQMAPPAIEEFPATGLSREERRRERRERRQNRAQNQVGRHCHQNPGLRIPGGAAVPPYEILPDLVNNHNHSHLHHAQPQLLPPPYSTLPLGTTLVNHHPPVVVGVGHLNHHHHHHHHHMALQRLRSASPPPLPLPPPPPPPVPILQPVPVASIANSGEDPRFLFQLPVMRR